MSSSQQNQQQQQNTQANSFLNLLNPYASIAQSTFPQRDNEREQAAPDDSPSAFLLRELQFEQHSSAAHTAHGADGIGVGVGVTGRRSSLSRSNPSPTSLSPTPTPSRRPSQPQPAHVLADSSSDEEGPPRSIVFGESSPLTAAAVAVTNSSATGTGTTAGTGTGAASAAAAATAAVPVRTGGWPPRAGVEHSQSPGPFRRRPSSASSSTRSRRSSPGGSHSRVGPPSRLELGQPSTMESIMPPSSSSPSSSPTPSSSPLSQLPRKLTRRASPVPPAPRPVLLVSDAGEPVAPPAQAIAQPAVPGPSRKPIFSSKTKGRGQRKYHAVGQDDYDENSGNIVLDDSPTRVSPSRTRYRGGNGIPSVRRSGLSAHDRALWKWVNIVDLDGFLQEVYSYYKGKGIWCIALARVLNLLTTFFVIAFSTFLLSCIDYTQLTRSVSGPNAVGRLDDALIGQCITRGSFPHMLFIIIVAAFYIFQLTTFVLSIPRLIDMWRFYTYLLGVPDADIQTLPWPEIVRRIGLIKKDNPVTSLSNGQAGALVDMVGENAAKAANAKLDAHDIANRILRQENYLIALFNKDLLDLRFRIPVPPWAVQLIPPAMLLDSPHTGLPRTNNGAEERKFFTFGGNALTKALEWSLRFCLMGYLFDGRGQVRQEVVRPKGRKNLVEDLRRRFIFMGILNFLFAPFIIVYLLIYSFFRYFEEYHKNPSSIGGRQYTPYAQWKFREFNELPHLFERRLDQSYPIAKEYIDQFPKERTALIMRFVAFVAGSFAAVLLAASLLDPDLFLHFEITPHRTVLFYLGVFGSILAIARGMIPEENLVFDPEFLLREVVRYTHYLPSEWQGKLHSQMVHEEFGTLFALKISVFIRELLSVLLTPAILWWSLPPCAGAIIDFFREFTVHVEGIGYVCSFAVFDFERQGNLGPEGAATAAGPHHPIEMSLLARRRGVHKTSAPVTATGHYMSTEHNKMEKSFLHFKATHPDWQPTDPGQSVYLDRLVGQLAHQNGGYDRGGYDRGFDISRYETSRAGGVASPHGTHLAASMYSGGRGLGLGLHLAGAAAAAGIPPSNGKPSALSPGFDARWTGRGDSRHLASLREDEDDEDEGDDADEEEEEDEDDGDAEALGWHRRAADDEDDVPGEYVGRGGVNGDGDGGRRLLRDAGKILNQVLRA